MERLLDDIWACKGQEYSLQPIVVKLRKKGCDESSHEWELIDGQQRLTTLFLVLHYMQRQGWKKMGAPYSISYETRPGSADYLKRLDPAECKKNIDYFHLFTAYECIGQWFLGKGDAYAQEDVASTFHGYLFKCVRVIWYEAPCMGDDDAKDSTTLFTRLNVGRIPLTDAELVKALLLSGVRNKNSDRAQELAAQWDGIERDLRNPDVWAFVVGADSGGDSDTYPTRISLLIDTLAPLPEGHPARRKRPRYYTFETLRRQIENDPEKFWERVVGLHALILGWFVVPQLYNKIGFLVATGNSFCELVQLGNGRKKSEFNQSLIGLIRRRTDICESELLDLRYDKKTDYSTILDLLLLMNVETVSRTAQHFSFRRHLGKTWSLEHIHAQNAESLTTVKQWKVWLEEHQNALRTLPDQQTLVQEISAALQKVEDRNFGSIFQQLAPRIVTAFTSRALNSTDPDHGVHAISNLALLSTNDNSALSNAVFEVKRQIVLDIDRNIDGKRDGYVPICTRNVFLKYYADADAQQIHFWGPQDKVSYYNAIISTLKDYFKPGEVAG